MTVEGGDTSETLGPCTQELHSERISILSIAIVIILYYLKKKKTISQPHLIYRGNYC